MKITITITTPRIALLALLAVFLISLSPAASVPVGTVWHPLNQITKTTSDKTSVDANNNGVIDNAARATIADTASSVPCTGVTVTGSGLPCANRLAVTVYPATAFTDDPSGDCQQACYDDEDQCLLRCTERFVPGPNYDSCVLGCSVRLDICLRFCGGGTTYQSCDGECTDRGGACAAAWKTADGKTAACSDNVDARQCACVSYT